MAYPSDMAGSIVEFNIGEGFPSDPAPGSINFDVNSGRMYISDQWIQVKDPTKALIYHASDTTAFGTASPTQYGHVKASSTTPKANGDANVGTETASFARGDHVHPLQLKLSNGQIGSSIKPIYIDENGLPQPVDGTMNSGGSGGSDNVYKLVVSNSPTGTTDYTVTDDTTTDTVYLNLVENGVVAYSHKISGANSISVVANSGEITIKENYNSVNTNAELPIYFSSNADPTTASTSIGYGNITINPSTNTINNAVLDGGSID